MFTMDDFENDKTKMLEFIQANGGYSSWVLKPQQEGGGNNYFGEAIGEQIRESSLENLQSQILMKRIVAE